jgi:hypothetical protein
VNSTRRALAPKDRAPCRSGVNARDRIGKGPWQNAKGPDTQTKSNAIKGLKR